MLNPTNLILKKAQVAGILERICQALEPTLAQYEIAKSRYESVSTWLADSEKPILGSASIYPQGSISIQTTVKPLAGEEYDVDLVCLVPEFTQEMKPAALKQLIGDRLRENARYREILIPKRRCWRLNYANEFHMDITPSILNPDCQQEGELVPDKETGEWKASNPSGYRRLFEERAKLQPIILLEGIELAEARAQVEALPEPTRFKGILRRTVQLCKRHRDIWFSDRNPDFAPISIVITTLASRSYEFCVRNNQYDTELDVLVDVVRRMPDFIEKRPVGDSIEYFVWNETTNNENFAEKWNLDRRLISTFDDWHAAAVTDFEKIGYLGGLDTVKKELSSYFGEGIVAKAMSAHIENINTARAGGLLSVAPGIGLSVGTSRGVSVRTNNFFGARFP